MIKGTGTIYGGICFFEWLIELSPKVFINTDEGFTTKEEAEKDMQTWAEKLHIELTKIDHKR